MVTNRGTGLAEGDDLGVGGWIGIGEIAVPAAADDLPVTDDHGADGHFTRVKGPLSGAERFFHEEFVGQSSCQCPVASWFLIVTG